MTHNNLEQNFYKVQLWFLKMYIMLFIKVFNHNYWAYCWSTGQTGGGGGMMAPP